MANSKFADLPFANLPFADLPFANYTLENESICKDYGGKSTYSDYAIDTSIDFKITLQIYKRYMSILIQENIEEDSDQGGGNWKTKTWNNKQKKIIIDLINFDYNNYIDIMITISDYINNYQFKYDRCGPVITIKKWDWTIQQQIKEYGDVCSWNTHLKKIPQFNIPNDIKTFMNNFLDFLILSNTNLGNTNLGNTEKIPKWIIIIVLSFLIEDDIIKLFEF